ncbi:MAG: AsmA family protein [Candidatus Omnitrophica bacterium]|nr:AsmA family protein [Candidatus Omnitrophota bacterium]
MKKFLIIVLILFLILFGVTLYLNKVLFPKKIKALIVSTLTTQTGKNVTLKSLEFSFLRGLVLRDLVVSDGKTVFLSTRQATCTVFFWPIFKKQIIIPSINLKSPYIFIQRRLDNSFNLQDFFLLKGASAKKSEFSVAVFKLTISDGDIVFQDDTLPVKFKKEIKNIKLNLQLGLPVKFRFNLTAELVNPIPVIINVSGDYKILSRELTGQLSLKNLSVQEFGAYYSDLGSLFSGLVDLQAQVNLKNQLLGVDLTAKADNLLFAKDNLKAKLGSQIQSKFVYNLDTKKLEFDGTCDIKQADITGLEFLGQVKNLSGKFVFNQRSLVADSIKAELMGVPFKINLGIKDFSTKVLNIDTDFDLNILPAIVKDKFNFSAINSATGRAALTIKIHPGNRGAWIVQGDLGIIGASLKFDKVDSLVEEIGAKLEFSQEGLSWADTKFKYKGASYQSSGTLFDFSSPKIKAKLFSDDLSVTGDFDLLDKIIKIGQFKGKYLDSQFLVSGSIDQTNPAKPQAVLTGSINLELSNLNKLLEKIYPQIKTIPALGQLDTQFSLSGPLTDFKNCYLQAKSTSGNFSLYGLKATDLSLDFLQEQGIAKIMVLYFSFYDGVIQGTGALNFNTEDLAYQVELNASGINLGKLKLDTQSKDKNISGIFLGQVKLNGAGSDLNKLDAAGNFAVSHGRLGELNLLQGLGKLLLAKDLGSIEFTECDCYFLLKNKFIYTDKLKIYSNIVNLAGPVKIGFDNSLEGALDVEILNEMVPLEGTFKDVTTAIIGKGGKFGTIKLGGTLNEPKYSFKTAVGNIIQGITNMLFKK